MSETKRVIVYVPEELHQVVTIMANEEGRKTSNFICQLLKNEAYSRGYLLPTSFKGNVNPITYAPAKTTADNTDETATDNLTDVADETTTDNTDDSTETVSKEETTEISEEMKSNEHKKPLDESEPSKASESNVKKDNDENIKQSVLKGVGEFCS